MSSLDLRFKFGVDQAEWVDPCRVIITQIVSGNIGFWVDEIQEVIETPGSGWGTLPPLLPRGVFTQTLLLNKKIYLYSEFEKLNKIPTSGYLRVYIEHLLAAEKVAQSLPGSKTTSSAQRVISSSTETQDTSDNNKTILHSHSTSTEINPNEKIQKPDNTSPASVIEQSIKDNIEEPTVTTNKPLPTSEDAKHTTSEKTIKSVTSDHHTLSDGNKIKPVISNSPIKKHTPTLTESRHNDVNPVEVKKSKHTNQPDVTTLRTTSSKPNDVSRAMHSKSEKVTATDSGNSPNFQEKVISSPEIDNQYARSLPDKRATPDNTSTNSVHHQTEKQTNNTSKQSSGTGMAMLLVLLLVLVPGLVWHFSKSDDIQSKKNISIANIINIENEKQVSNVDRSEIIQSTTNKKVVSISEPEEAHDTSEDEHALDIKSNSLNLIETDNSSQTEIITEHASDDDKNNQPNTENSEELISNDSTDANLPVEPTTQTTHPQKIETESITTYSNDNTEPTDYRADIQPDDDGITIILEAPEEAPVFKSETTSYVDTTSKLENDSSVSESTPKETDIERRIEKNQTASDSSTRSKANTVGQLEAIDSISTAKKTASPITQTEITHIVVKGDTLWHIAIRYVNNPYKYPELARLSNIKNPDLIYPGNRVRIIKKIRRIP